MYQLILDHLRERPPAYAGNVHRFWGDEHISRYMLEAHLDPEGEGASRNHAFIRRSARWIAEQYPPERFPALLDLGCGPGLYAELFHDAGYSVTGVDFSPRSIRYAREHVWNGGKSINYLCSSYLELDREVQFDLAVLIYCDFGALDPDAREDLLRRVKRALKPGGVLLLDGFTEAHFRGFTEKRTAEYQESGFWSPQPYLCVQSDYRYDAEKAYLRQYLVVNAEECRCYQLWDQGFSRASLQEELEEAGFVSFRFYGDVCGAPFAEDGDCICAAAGGETPR